MMAFDLTGAVSAVAWRTEDGRRGKRAFPSTDASAMLTPTLEEILADGREPLSMLGVAKGPGSFTGIRIGLATALGIRMSMSIPVLGFTLFELMAVAMGPGNYTLVLQGPGQRVFCAPYRDGLSVARPRACPAAELRDTAHLKGIQAIEGLNMEIAACDLLGACLDILENNPTVEDHDLEPLYL